MKEFGEDVRTVRWSSKRCQYLHFLELLQALPKNRWGKPTVLDVGCGFADIIDFIHEDFFYVGIEANEEIFLKAKERVKGYKGMTIVSDMDILSVNKAYDVVICCGTLNGFSTSTQYQYINKMWSITDQVLAFNFITRPQDDKFVKDLVYMDAGAVFNHCLTLKPSRIEMISGYWFGDVTIRMWR